MSEFRRRLMMVGGGSNIPNYLCFTALESGTFTFRIGKSISTAYYQYVEYSTDDCVTWVKTNNVNNTEVTITTPTITAGNKVYWRGSGTYISNYITTERQSNFTTDGKFDASGNLASLCGLDNFDNWEATTVECQFINVFSGTKIVDAGELILPKFNKNRPYWYAFSNCNELTVMPDIPNQNVLYQNSFTGMFSGCSKLLYAKSLPATTLANSCYESMFKNCTSLKSATSISGKNLVDSCFKEMFYGCTALENTPSFVVDSATGNNDMYRMFQGCTSLTDASGIVINDFSGNNICDSMFRDCSNLVDKVPTINAVNASQNCFGYMFYGCSKLTSTPSLLANILFTNSYQHMLQGTKVNYIKMLATDISASSCLAAWLAGVPNVSTSIFVKHIDAQWTTTGDSAVPSNWTIIYYDPAVDKYYTDQTRATECDDHGNPI